MSLHAFNTSLMDRRQGPERMWLARPGKSLARKGKRSVRGINKSRSPLTSQIISRATGGASPWYWKRFSFGAKRNGADQDLRSARRPGQDELAPELLSETSMSSWMKYARLSCL